MQIDRRPNRGPYVAALICLLTLCLTIPIYWQSSAQRARNRAAELTERDRIARAAAERQLLTAKLGGNFVRIDRYPSLTTLIPCPESVNTLDELLFQIANRPNATARVEHDLFAELLGPPPAPLFDPATLIDTMVWPYLSHCLRQVSSDWVELTATQPWAGWLAVWHAEPPAMEWRSYHASRPPLVLAGPNDRLAMAPPQVAAPPEQVTVDAFPSPWCVPAMLIERLEVLAENPHSAAWAQATLAEVQSLTASENANTAAVAAQLERLRELNRQAMTLAADANDDYVRAELLRAHWGLARRLECWALMRDIAVASAAQNRFAAHEPWDSTRSVMVGQGTGTLDLRSLSYELEQYERNRTPRVARAILKRQLILAQANDSRGVELANQIEQNYRNANIRLALSGELLQRFVPKQQAETAPVCDRIAGTPVRGQSITSSANRLALRPDAQRWNVNLESDGAVDSDTFANGGQVTVHTLSTTNFTASKAIVVERDGVQLGEASVAATNRSRLVSVHSNFDWMPVVNDVVRTRAIEEFRRKRPLAKAEVECKVADRVERQLNDRAGNAVDKVQHQMREQVTAPLANAGIELTPIELSTTEQRVIARLRVAGPNQLAGHTPRPRAPADSLASLQVHESALTNAAMSLALDGKRLTAAELQAFVREKLARTNQPPATVVDADTIFDFAAEDAVRFRVADSRLELILAMREVNHEGNVVRNFRVHAFYVPAIHGLEAEFVRDGALGIEGRLRAGERARMHGVFNKVLSEDRKLPIVRLNNADDERLADLMITQLVLEDGWIGLALGPVQPERTAERSRMLR